jgi:hypothetical protein
MGNIFLSVADDDWPKAAILQQELQKLGYSIWAARTHVKAGSEWDRAIQEALDSSSHVLVLATQAGVDSSYVRAEVEYALNADHTVIPILVEGVRIPVRWSTLQYVDARALVDWKEIGALVARALPRAAPLLLEAVISQGGEFRVLQELILSNEAWLRATVFFPYSHRQAGCTNVHVPEGGNIDYFLVNANSGGCDAYIFYLCSPWSPPFSQSGAMTAELGEVIKTSMRHACILLGRPSSHHPLHPPREVGEYMYEVHGYREIRVQIFAGIREHYQSTVAAESRWRIQKECAARLSEVNAAGSRYGSREYRAFESQGEYVSASEHAYGLCGLMLSFDISSYTRLQEAALRWESSRKQIYLA